ncbi:GNAT family N-acetyltransferase [Actinomadura viridis]|uniref:GNAT family N-acetyltransferase n=1 Tax=Actinomadura viridis TaxID=58110 RepID=UPI00369EBDF6
MKIRAATTDDVDAVIALRIESEAWLHSAGIQQWVDRARGVRNIRDGIAAGNTYVVEHESTVVASLTLAGPDPDFWTDADIPSSALYLYKFMIGSPHRGTGLGSRLLDWACDQARQRQKLWLRLDCWRENKALQRYYMQHGFQHVRTVVVAGRGSGALFQRPVLAPQPSHPLQQASRR